MATKVSLRGRQHRDGIGRHIQQYSLNAEPVDKKLAVLAVLESTNNIRATII